MNKTHRLINNATAKILNLTCKDNILLSESGKEDKLRVTEKSFSDEEASLKAFYKKEWDALKKGFTFVNPQASLGEPLLHTYIGGGYTGALSFASTSEGVYVYKNTESSDVLILLDSKGNQKKEITLPKFCAWSIEYQAFSNSLFIDVDRFIYKYDIDKDKFVNIGDEENSFISVSESKVALGTKDKINIITDSKAIVLFPSSNNQFDYCGALSPDGNLLAFCNNDGKITIFDTIEGKVLHTIQGNFEEIAQMEYTCQNQLLVVREKYGTRGMRYFDLNTNKEVTIKELEIPQYTKDVNAFCFNKSQTRLVLVQGSDVHVFDYIKNKELHHFKIEHIVKSCKIKFVEEYLGVRTDYGCFSLYVV